MNLRGFKVLKALVVFVIVIALGLGFQYIHRQRAVINPLAQRLENIPGISQVSVAPGILKKHSQTVINLNTDFHVPLSMTFGQLRATLQDAGGNYTIKLENNSDDTLWQVFQQIQIMVEEAIMTGEFTVLEQKVEAVAIQEEISSELALDREFIYLRLKNGPNFLQKVISRGVEDMKINFYTKEVNENGKVD